MYYSISLPQIINQSCLSWPPVWFVYFWPNFCIKVKITNLIPQKHKIPPHLQMVMPQVQMALWSYNKTEVCKTETEVWRILRWILMPNLTYGLPTNRQFMEVQHQRLLWIENRQEIWHSTLMIDKFRSSYANPENLKKSRPKKIVKSNT